MIKKDDRDPRQSRTGLSINCQAYALLRVPPGVDDCYLLGIMRTPPTAGDGHVRTTRGVWVIMQPYDFKGVHLYIAPFA